MAEVVCDGFIEVALTSVGVGMYGEQRVLLPPGTLVDAPCEHAVATGDPVITWHGTTAEWVCPRCGKTNVREGPWD